MVARHELPCRRLHDDGIPYLEITLLLYYPTLTTHTHAHKYRSCALTFDIYRTLKCRHIALHFLYFGNDHGRRQGVSVHGNDFLIPLVVSVCMLRYKHYFFVPVTTQIRFYHGCRLSYYLLYHSQREKYLIAMPGGAEMKKSVDLAVHHVTYSTSSHHQIQGYTAIQ